MDESAIIEMGLEKMASVPSVPGAVVGGVLGGAASDRPVGGAMLGAGIGGLGVPLAKRLAGGQRRPHRHQPSRVQRQMQEHRAQLQQQQPQSPRQQQQMTPQQFSGIREALQ